MFFMLFIMVFMCMLTDFKQSLNQIQTIWGQFLFFDFSIFQNPSKITWNHSKTTPHFLKTPSIIKKNILILILLRFLSYMKNRYSWAFYAGSGSNHQSGWIRIVFSCSFVSSVCQIVKQMSVLWPFLLSIKKFRVWVWVCLFDYSKQVIHNS